MCLYIASTCVRTAATCLKGFNLGITADNKYKLLLPHHHGPASPDFLIGHEYFADPTVIRDFHGNSYYTGYHAYKSVHRWLDSKTYLEYLAKNNSVIMKVYLDQIHSVGYQSDWPCYVSAKMSILELVNLRYPTTVYDSDKYTGSEFGSTTSKTPIDMAQLIKDITAYDNVSTGVDMPAGHENK